MRDDVIQRYEYLKTHTGYADLQFPFHANPTSIRTLAGGFLVIVGLGLFIFGVARKIQDAQKAKSEDLKDDAADAKALETNKIPTEKKFSI
ncbi:hypothetical protein CJU89_6318 [Yarrowia sp. B02]|nr:hypothetical protein CJU89_6318 [Yarrowia sp. B02]